MSSVTADSFGGLVPDPRSPLGHLDVRDKPSRRAPALQQHMPAIGNQPDVGKWPAWKVSLFVVVFCGAFWGGLIYLGMHLFG